MKYGKPDNWYSTVCSYKLNAITQFQKIDLNCKNIIYMLNIILK